MAEHEVLVEVRARKYIIVTADGEVNAEDEAVDEAVSQLDGDGWIVRETYPEYQGEVD